MSDEFENDTDLQLRLTQLRVEHRDLDAVINQLMAVPIRDELLIRRLKKRKLALKDKICVIERMLEPDELA